MKVQSMLVPVMLVVSVLGMACGGATRGAGEAVRAPRSGPLPSRVGGYAADSPGTRLCEMRTVYFGLDSEALDDGTRGELERAARCLRGGARQSVHLTGATDPRGTEEYNLALGDRRAHAVMRYLVALGVGESTLTYTSVGEEVSMGAEESTWAYDRRVEYVGMVHPSTMSSLSAREEIGAMLGVPRR